MGLPTGVISMEFGFFCGGYLPNAMRTSPDAEHDRLMSEIRLAQVADQNNWKYFWTTEHHFLDEYSHISASEVMLAHVAATTERIHVGSGIFNITPPVNHPIRTAERVAMLDHLSGGRFEFGTGRGSSTTEQRGFGIDDPELTREMYDEVIGEFRKMWSQDEYSFDGKYFSVPPRKILPKPYVKPHPPMWVAAGNPGTFEKAGRMGLGVLCFTTGAPSKLAPMIEIYKDAISKAEPVGDYINDNVAVTTNFMCLEDREEAIDLMMNSGNGYHQSLVFRYLDTFPKPKGLPDWPALIPDPTREQIEAGIAAGISIVGSPDDCAEVIKGIENIGADTILLGPSSSMYPHDVMERTMKLFGQEVIPRFDLDPSQTKTARLRKEAAVRLGLI